MTQYELEEATKKYNAAVERKYELWAEAEAEADRQFKAYGTAGTAINYVTREYHELEAAVEDLKLEMDAAQDDVQNHEKAIEKDAKAIAGLEEEMSFAEETVNGFLKAMGLATDKQKDFVEGEGPLQEALAGTKKRLQELAEEYTEAYEAAKESFSGQFGLFDIVQADADATVAAAQRALDSQLSYWQGYAQNIEVLSGISAEKLGVTQANYDALMAYVRSGTPEAAGLAADMAKAVNEGNTQALTNVANTLGEIDKYQSKAARDMAEWTSGLTEQTEQLILDIKEDISALELSHEAAESGRATIQAFIDSADDMLPEVQRAYEKVAAEARNALASSELTYVGGGQYILHGRLVGGYASGTDSAPPGWAWVGERGPELMRFSGGETVLPAEISREFAILNEFYSQNLPGYAGGTGNVSELLAISNAAYETYHNALLNHGGSIGNTAAYGDSNAAMIMAVEAVPSVGGMPAPVSVEVHIHLEGNATPETVEDLEDYVRRGELQEAVEDIFANIKIDAARGAYA